MEQATLEINFDNKEEIENAIVAKEMEDEVL